MKEYTYMQIEPGMQEEFSCTITEEMQESFSKLSGDINPLHIDEGYAKEAGFSGRVVYGLLHSSFYSQLIGNYLPGKYCLLQKLEVKFRKPVYIGERVTVSGRVAEKQDAFQSIVIKAKIQNEKKETVSTATIAVKVVR